VQNPLANLILSHLYSTICHKDIIKCISFGNAEMLVCARCAGIYIGALISAILSLLISINPVNRRYLILSSFPLLLDVILVMFGVYSYSKFVSFATGIIFGSVIYLVIILEFEKIIGKQKLKM
jgi:uncharacterized membrane protein